MSTLAESTGEIKKPWRWMLAGGLVLLVWGAVAFPNLLRTKLQPMSEPTVSKPLPQFYVFHQADANHFALASRSEAIQSAGVAKFQPNAAAEQKIIRTSSLEMVVQHPSEVADKITAIAESLGGYVTTANGGGENATVGTLTIRVPSGRFDEARTEIRKLGLRVNGERIDAQDVTRQYVDQDASLRNLKAEETQYLSILKQANTVKDMLAVTEKLSEVRGQIEEQQAEFNALSKQIETVAITISLRTEVEEKVFGLNWRPLYQLKLAVRDGLESLANYVTAMLTIVFYLPAVLLWVGTILAGITVSWRVARWVGIRWFGWKITEQPVVAK